jgi:phospholipase C
MAAFVRALRSFAVMYPILGASVLAGSLTDIEHVILFMQGCSQSLNPLPIRSLKRSPENRAFDHYFGTMAGVRGFSDPNVQVNSGTPVWYQDVTPALTSAASYLLPWYLNYEGDSWLNATQCMIAGDNGWNDNHAALNGGLNNHWATNNTPWSWSHFKRSDIPVQYAIADGWTVGDMYQVS